MKYDYITFVEGKARMEKRFIEKEYLTSLWLVIPACTFLLITKAWVCSPVILFFWFVNARQKTDTDHKKTMESMFKFHPDFAYIYKAQEGLIPRVHYKQLVDEYSEMKEFLKDAPITQQEKDKIIKPYQDHMMIMIKLKESCRGLYPDWVPVTETWENRTTIAKVKAR